MLTLGIQSHMTNQAFINIICFPSMVLICSQPFPSQCVHISHYSTSWGIVKDGGLQVDALVVGVSDGMVNLIMSAITETLGVCKQWTGFISLLDCTGLLDWPLTLNLAKNRGFWHVRRNSRVHNTQSYTIGPSGKYKGATKLFNWLWSSRQAFVNFMPRI